MTNTQTVTSSSSSDAIYHTKLDFNVGSEIRFNQKQEADLILKGSGRKEEILLLGEAPQLKAPGKQNQGDDALDDMTQAFCAVFTTMAQGTETENHQLLQLQQLDQSSSEAVMDTCNIAIEDQQKALQLEQDIQNQEDKANAIDKDIGWLSYLGIGMTVLSVLLSIPTAGASDALLAAEVAGDSAAGGAGAGGDGAAAGAGAAAGGAGAAGAEAGAVAAADGEAIGAADQAVQAGAEAAPQVAGNGARDVAADAVQAGERGGQNVAEDAAGNGERVGQNGGRAPARANCQCHGCRYNNLTRWEKFSYRVAKFRNWVSSGDSTRLGYYHKVFGLVGNVAASAPQFTQGLMQVQVAPKQEQLAALQEATADPTATVQLNQMDFQFYSQLSQRQGDVCQNEGEQLSDVIQLAGGIMKGYTQVQSNLLA